MKCFKKLLSLILALLFVLQLLPMQYLGMKTIEAFAAETNYVQNGYEFDIPEESDNTVDVEIPETFIVNDDLSFSEKDFEYKYNENLSTDENRLYKLALEHKNYSELEDLDKEFLSEYFSLGDSGQAYFEILENKGYIILASTLVFDLLQKAQCDFESFTALNISPDTTQSILCEFETYLENIQEDFLGTTADNTIRKYLLQGYSVNEVVNAYAISETLEIEMSALLTGNSDNDLQTTIYRDLETDSKEFSNAYSVSPNAISNYIESNDISEEDVESINDIISSVVGDYITTYSAYGTTEPITTPYYYDFNENEFISLNSGSLIYRVTDYVLPGKNGLDLEIGRIYSSYDSKIDEIYYDSDSSDVISSLNRHNDALYGLGKGWSFAFTSIERIGLSNEIIHLSNGETYQLKGNELIGYEYSDITITRGSASNCNCDSEYVVKYYDGREEHISGSVDNGCLNCIKDRYGNTITFSYEYASWNKMGNITITDTIGRVVNISIEYPDDYNRIVTVSLPNNLTLTYNVHEEPLSFLPAISSFVDANGNTTYYSYTINRGNCFWDATSETDMYTIYSALTTITHPTNAQTVFEYDIALQRIGSYYDIEYPRIRKRYDVINSNKYNEISYEYTVNNKLQTIETTVTNPSNLKITSKFNIMNKLDSVSLYDNNVTLEETSYLYDYIYMLKKIHTEIHRFYNSSEIYNESTYALRL